MRKNIVTVALVTISLLTSVVGAAQDRSNKEKDRPNPEKILEHLDTDEDGKLNKEEVSKAKRGRLAEQFDEVDTNSDGFIDLEEFKKFHEQRPKRREE
ncbi:MAG: EF-hand domain-containing protein [Flavobacteriaceae bacterium]